MARRKFYKSELTVNNDSNSKSKNFLGVLMSIVVLVLISSMIVVAIVIINPDVVNLPGKAYATREAITLEEALLGELAPNNFAFQWHSSLESGDDTNQKPDVLLFEDSKNLNFISMQQSQLATEPTNTTRSQNLTINKQVVDKFQPQIVNLISNTSLLTSIDYQGYKVSPSKRYLLVWTNKKKQFRHSFVAKYFVYDMKLDLISLLSTASTEQPESTGEPQGNNILPVHHSYENLDAATQYLNELDEGSERARFQLVDWYTNGVHDSLILIQNNDIYLLENVEPISNGTNQRASPTRITFTGKSNEIFNGIPDWLYEEEILAYTPAFQISPKTNTLAYMSFNDSQVDSMPYTFYGTGEQRIPQIERIRYPKAGRVNPRVTVRLLDGLASASERDIKLELPGELAQREHYINRINWLTDDKLFMIWLNRNQNESYFLICTRQSKWKCEENLHITVSDGWLDLSDDIYPLSEDYYLALLPKYEGPEVGSFKHVARVSLKQANTYSFLTSGQKEVTQINGIDKTQGILYYTSTVEREPGQRHLFSASLEENSRLDICLTCDHHPDECLYNYIKMSPSTHYYIFECEGPGVPRTELRQSKVGNIFAASKKIREGDWRATTAGNEALKNNTSNLNTLPSLGDLVQKAIDVSPTTSSGLQKSFDNTLLWTIEDNQALRDRLTLNKVMPLTMRLKVPIPNTNYSANVLMLLPPQLGSLNTFPGRSVSSDFNSKSRGQSRARSISAQSGNNAASGLEQPIHAYFTPDSISMYTNQLASGQQYPMVVDVYGGPGSQKVDYRYNIHYGYYLASARRTIYAMIDGRGSGFQGSKRLYELYHKLGTVEIEDQIEVTAYLTRKYSFIDSSKVAIWGWSYGGYAAAMALAQSNARARQTLKQLQSLSIANSTPIDTSKLLRIPASAGTAIIRPPQFSASVFECAISVAPVTNWVYYDTAYTERFMSSPYPNEQYDLPGDHQGPGRRNKVTTYTKHEPISERWLSLSQTVGQSTRAPLADLLRSRFNSSSINPNSDLNERYKRASLINHIDDIDRKRFLLIHGTADDNVHFQQSIMLMKRLIQKNVLYESQLYPDQDHGIANKADKLHLGSTLTNFFAECFDMAY